MITDKPSRPRYGLPPFGFWDQLWLFIYLTLVVVPFVLALRWVS